MIFLVVPLDQELSDYLWRSHVNAPFRVFTNHSLMLSTTGPAATANIEDEALPKLP